MRPTIASRRVFLSILTGLACICGCAHQIVQAQPSELPRVGVLSGFTRANSAAYLRLPDALRDLGWMDGKNVTVDWRFANGDPATLPSLAFQLVQLRPSVIVVGTNFEAEAILSINRVIPLVLWTGLDPVGSGLARTLSHPGGSITGLLWADPGLGMV